MTDQAFTTSNLSTDMPELCIDDFQHSTIGDLKTEIALMTTRLKEWEETNALLERTGNYLPILPLPNLAAPMMPP